MARARSRKAVFVAEPPPPAGPPTVVASQSCYILRLKRDRAMRSIAAIRARATAEIIRDCDCGLIVLTFAVEDEIHQLIELVRLHAQADIYDLALSHLGGPDPAGRGFADRVRGFAREAHREAAQWLDRWVRDTHLLNNASTWVAEADRRGRSLAWADVVQHLSYTLELIDQSDTVVIDDFKLAPNPAEATAEAKVESGDTLTAEDVAVEHADLAARRTRGDWSNEV